MAISAAFVIKARYPDGHQVQTQTCLKAGTHLYHTCMNTHIPFIVSLLWLRLLRSTKTSDVIPVAFCSMIIMSHAPNQ